MSHTGKSISRSIGQLVLMGLAAILPLTSFTPHVFAQNVTVRVTILEVRNLSVGDGLDEVDWYATVTIAGDEMDNEDEADEDEGNDHLFPDWEFSKSVPLSDGSVAVNIEIRDEDDFLKLGDDLADINPDNSKADLDMTVALAPCAVSGDVMGQCRHNLFSGLFGPNPTNNGDGRAEIRFKIEVLGAPGLLVRCTHLPLWPQPGDTVALKVEALDGNVNSRTVDTLELVREGLPDDTAAAQASHSLSFTAAGDSFVYGCRAIDGNETEFSELRRVIVGDPPVGERAVPVLLNTKKVEGVDILLVPDKDDYPALASDPLFLEHAANSVYSSLRGIYSERVFLERQGLVNIFLGLDPGDAREYEPATGGCDHVAPAGFDTVYSFADATGILHTDLFRDCARRGDRIFSAEPPQISKVRTFLHELGHAPFGLADEYCNKRPGSLGDNCDGGYGFLTAFFPNVFNSGSPVSCAQDASDNGFDPMLCVPWIDDRGGGPFSTYDPINNDLMSDRGDLQFLDLRRINGVFDNCPSGGC